MPYSPRYYQNKLWLHNSGTGYFGYLDLKTGEFEEVAFVPGYARGLAFWSNFALIGLSKPRDQTFSGLELDQTLKDKQAKPRCGLVVVDINTGNIVHWVWIEGQVRELYDIQIIPGVQRASIVKDDDESPTTIKHRWAMLFSYIPYLTLVRPPDQAARRSHLALNYHYQNRFLEILLGLLPRSRVFR